jgi:hypothetical protein
MNSSSSRFTIFLLLIFYYIYFQKRLSLSNIIVFFFSIKLLTYTHESFHIYQNIFFIIIDTGHLNLVDINYKLYEFSKLPETSLIDIFNRENN